VLATFRPGSSPSSMTVTALRAGQPKADPAGRQKKQDRWRERLFLTGLVLAIAFAYMYQNDARRRVNGEHEDRGEAG
jgi:hypothetical protein